MTTTHSHDVFRGDVLDRCGNLRGDPDWLATQRSADSARYLVLWRYRVPLSASGLVYLTAAELSELGLTPDDAQFLGQTRDTAAPRFLLDVSAHEEDSLTGSLIQEFRDLRMSARRLSSDDLAVVGFAKALLHWQRAHRYCPKCGVDMVLRHGGHLLEGDNDACDCKHFPRTDPAVIMLISAGDHALLGRQAGWPKGVFSALAGFVEPGESAEDAVRREVMEETGVAAGNLRYVTSQPWPFPGSLMIGFRGDAERTDPIVDEKELDDARWFSRRELAEGVEAGKLILPPPISIARTLVRDWYEAEGATPLRSAFD